MLVHIEKNDILPPYLNDYVNEKEMVCGVVYFVSASKFNFRPEKNMSPSPELRSEVSPQVIDDISSSEDVVCVLCCLSDSEQGELEKYQEMSDRCGYIYRLYFLPSNNRVDVLPDCIFESYEGRPYISNKYDCYSLVREYLLKEFGIYLNEYSRRMSGHDRNQHIIEQHMPEEGFIQIENEEMQPGDFLALNPDFHGFGVAAIYVGDGEVLHHPHFRKSRYAPYSDILKSCTRSIWRHKSLITR